MSSGVERIATAFAHAPGRAALMPYVLGDWPDHETSIAVGEACIAAGADLLELGVPYSDPLADGPVIHGAATEALRAGASWEGVLEVAQHLGPEVPTVLMTYANPVLARGVERVVDELAAAGACGVIVPDLLPEDSGALRERLDAAGLALVPLAAPTTPADRLATIGAQARGFVYAVSVTGTTGERAQLDPSTVVPRVKQASAVPVALGFGISTGAHASAAADAGADGVIVASRLIREASGADDPAAAVGAAVEELAAALRSPAACS